MPRDFDSLIAVIHADVLDAPSGQTPRQIAENLGFKRYTTFMNQLEQQDGFKLDANMVLPLMRQTGSKRPLHYLADRMDCVVLELPQAIPGLDALSLQALKAVEEVGHVMGSYREAVADGVVTPVEKRQVRDKIYGATAALMTFAKSLEEI